MSDARLDFLEEQVRRMTRENARRARRARRVRSVAVQAGLSVLVLLPALATAVEPPHEFSNGDVISASEMNESFEVLAAAISVLESGPPPSQTYGALIVGSAAEDETRPWIDGVTGGGGTFQVDFAPSAFRAQPICTVTPQGAGIDGVMAMISQLNAGGVTVELRRDGSITIDASFYLVCTAG